MNDNREKTLRNVMANIEHDILSLKSALIDNGRFEFKINRDNCGQERDSIRGYIRYLIGAEIQRLENEKIEIEKELKQNNMSDFNAQKAREIVSTNSKSELNDILSNIELLAYSGKSSLRIDKPISNETYSGLIEKGFVVNFYTETQKEYGDGYCIIIW